MYGVVHHATKRYGSPPAAIPRRATRRVATRQMPQAYPPQRGSVQCPNATGRCSTYELQLRSPRRRSERIRGRESELMTGLPEHLRTIESCRNAKTRRLLNRNRAFRFKNADFVSKTQISFQKRRLRSKNADFVPKTQTSFQKRRLCSKNAEFVPKTQTLFQKRRLRFKNGDFVPRTVISLQ
jgi:hypothetical protein